MSKKKCRPTPIMVLIRCLFAALCIIVATTPSEAGSGRFQPYKHYTTGRTPVSVAVGDFNGDRKPDLAVANSGESSVSVLLGNGKGGFQRQIKYTTCFDPVWIETADLDGDKKLDLGVVCNWDRSVYVLLGNGDGTFQVHWFYSAGLQYPPCLSIGDLDNDHIPDLMISEENHLVLTMLGNGDGTFRSYNNFFSNRASACASADLNGDGNLDFVSADSFGDDVYVLLGNGDGSFQPFVYYPTGDFPTGIAIQDFNGDGKPDLVTSNIYSENISIFLGDGDGSFQARTDYPTGASPRSIAAADFNGDGRLDLVVSSDGMVDVLLGSGDGSFPTYVAYAAGPSIWATDAADLNHDGASDIVVTNAGNYSASVLLNSGGSSVKLTSSPNPSQLGQPVTFAVTVKPTFANVGNVSGSVTFKDGQTILGTIPIVSGAASLTTSDLGLGNHRITSIYSGDQNFNRNVATPLAQVVQ